MHFNKKEFKIFKKKKDSGDIRKIKSYFFPYLDPLLLQMEKLTDGTSSKKKFLKISTCKFCFVFL